MSCSESCAASPPGPSSACSWSWRTAFPNCREMPTPRTFIGMAIIGLMMVVLTHAFGHPYVDGVGYGVIQSTLDNKMTSAGLLALLFVAEDARDHDQSRMRRLRRHLLAVALSRSHPGRGLRPRGGHDPSARRPDRAFGGDRRHGRDGWRGHRRRHDRHRHGLRNDARLRHHRSRDRRRRGRGRHPADADWRNDLYDQTAPSRPPHPEGAAHQSLSGQAGSGHHGAAFHPGQGWNNAERSNRRRKTPTICAPSSSSARAGSSASFRRARVCGANLKAIRTCWSNVSSKAAPSFAGTSIS